VNDNLIPSAILSRIRNAVEWWNTRDSSRPHFDLCEVRMTAVRTVSGVVDVRAVLRNVWYGRSRSGPVFPFDILPAGASL
jgi:hypothetical protein